MKKQLFYHFCRHQLLHRVKASHFKTFFILFIGLHFSILSTPLISQNKLEKLDTLKPSLWLSSYNTPKKSDKLSAGYINNYQLLNPEEVQRHLQNDVGTMRANTLFFVLVPKFEHPQKAQFLQGNNFSISDEGVTTNGMFSHLNYKVGQPTIITIKVQPTYRYGRVQNNQQLLNIINDEIFDVAELMVYEDLLSTDETRYIETYLALKYSVNISNNKVADKRNYLGDKSHYWFSPVEARFNEHIIGLGRNDKLNFYQTQTFTTDASNYRLTFDLNQPVGFEADDKALEDQSHIIFSKTRGLGLGSNCGEVTTQSAFAQWKFKLMNWQNAHPYIYLCVQKSAEENRLSDSVVITNGIEEFSIPVLQNEQNNYLQIPLTHLKNDLHYYIRKASESNDCPNQILTLQHADSATIYVDSPNEPLNLTLVNLDNGLSENISLNSGSTTYKLAPHAQYRLDLYDTEGKLLHSEVISNGNSKSIKNIVIKHNTRGEGDADSIPKPSLMAYPNPSEKGMAVSFELQNIKADNYKIQVLDKAGRVITQDQRMMDKNNNQWQHTFYTAGSYTVIFYTTQIKLTQTVVIK